MSLVETGLIFIGGIMKIIKKPSPNHGGKVSKLKYIVLHHTGGKMPGDLNWLRNKKAKASANYLVNKGGKVYELVAPGVKAWHAGCGGPYKGVPKDSMNAYSIGIEISNLGNGKDAYPEAQLTALDSLISFLDKKYGKLTIIDHKTWAPGRKNDMSKNFPLGNYLKYRCHKKPLSASAHEKFVLKSELKAGTSHHETTKVLQQRLNALGITDKFGRRLTVDGNFGASTTAAVNKFKKSHKLKTNGVVGKGTAQALGWKWGA